MGKVTILTKDQLSQWDDFVGHHPYGWLTHLTLWERILKSIRSITHCFYLAVIDETNGSIQAGLPVYLTESPLTKKNLIAAPLTTIYDPLVSNEDQFNMIVNEACRLLKETGSSKIIFKALNAAKYFQKKNFAQAENFLYHQISLNDSLENIFKRFHRSCVRQHINKSSRFGLKLKIGNSIEDLKQFYKLYQKTRKEHGLPSIPFAYFRSIWEVLSANKNVIVLLVEYKSKAIAGLMGYIYKKNFSAEAMGWDSAYKDFTPAIFIFWEAIKYAFETGCQSFDFGRTAASNKSLVDFKRRWGTEEKILPLYIYQENRSREIKVKESKNVRKIASEVFRFLPSPIYSAISNIFYRLYCE